MEYKVKRSDILQHYASQYYDPVKAHEYYEEHKKLKGSSSTPEGYKQNDSGKEASLYVSKQISDRKEALTKQAKTDIETAKTETETNVQNSINETAQAVMALAEELFATPQSEMQKKGKYFKKQITNLRKKNAENKKKLSKEYSEKVKSIREQLKSQKEALTNANKEEQAKIKNDSSMLEASKGSKNGTGELNIKKSSDETRAKIQKDADRIKARNESSKKS